MPGRREAQEDNGLMADELTPQEQRELEAIDRALSGRSVDPDLEDIAALTNQLHGMRATPTPEFADELDRHAASWLGHKAEKPRRKWLRVGMPAFAAAAAAVAVALVVSGDSTDPTLELSAAPGQRSAAVPQEDAAGQPETIVIDADGLRVSYTVFRTTTARVKLGDREETIELPPGAGAIQISAKDYEPGDYPLDVTIGDAHESAQVTLD